MSLDADVIIPVTTANDQTYLLAVVALRTCRASTSARVWAIINNSPPSALRSRLAHQCELLGINVLHWHEPFSLSKIFNFGQDMTKGKYIAYGTSDVIYFPNWLENIVDLWREHPEYYCLCNYSFDDAPLACCKNNVQPIRQIQYEKHPSSGVTVFKRESGWRWDEHFKLWEIDADLDLFLERNRLKSGFCLNARCDHLIDSIKSVVKGSDDDHMAARRYLETKYNLEPMV